MGLQLETVPPLVLISHDLLLKKGTTKEKRLHQAASVGLSDSPRETLGKVHGSCVLTTRLAPSGFCRLSK